MANQNSCCQCIDEVSNRAMAIFYLTKRILLGVDVSRNAARIQSQVRLLEKHIQKIREKDASISNSDKNI